MKRIALISAFGVALLAGGQATASLIGDTVAFSTSAGFGPNHYVVQAGVVEELDLNSVGLVAFDWEDSSIEITFLQDFQHVANTWEFTSLDWLDEAGNVIDGEIVGLTVVSPGPLPVVTFGAHEVYVDFVSEFYLIGDTIRIDLLVEHNPIPEPATVTLLGLGLAGFALRRRMKA